MVDLRLAVQLPLSTAISEALSTLPEREKLVITCRYGLEGGPMTLEEVGSQMAVTRERVRQLEAKVLRRLRHPSRCRYLQPYYDTLTYLSARLGCDMTSQEFADAAGRALGWAEGVQVSDLGLLAQVFGYQKPPKESSLEDIDHCILVKLAQSPGPVSLQDIMQECLSSSHISMKVQQWPHLDPAERLRWVLGISVDGDGMCRIDDLQQVPLSTRDLRVCAMVRVLRRAGHPLHYEEICAEIGELLPADKLLHPRNVHAWLDRYKDYFTWVGPGTYGLREWDMGRSTLELSPELKPARRSGVGDEIAALLEERGGPVPLDEIIDWVTERFVVKESSVVAAIQQDRARRFALLGNGYVGLAGRDGHQIAPGARRKLLARVPQDVLQCAEEKARERVAELRDAVQSGLSLLDSQKLTRLAVLASCLGLRDEFSLLISRFPDQGVPARLRLAMMEMVRQ